MKELTLTPHLKKKLRRLAKEPEKLYCAGDPAILEGHTIVAIVGTRKPTPYGKAMTTKLAGDLAKAGVIIASGNAIGVDVIAQKAALDNDGKVISVLPSGLDNIYPATNRRVAEQIRETSGLLISEYKPGHNPTRYDFLHRNRLIAAMSDLVIVVEAAEKSGSLNTAKHAKDIKMPIAAVPGNVTSPMSSGTNALLKEGAHLVRSAEDVLKILGISPSAKQTLLNLEGDDEIQTRILQSISSGIADPHEIQTQANISATEFQVAVTMLEVNGRIATNDLGQLVIK